MENQTDKSTNLVMEICSCPEIAIGVAENDLDALGDWAECFPVLCNGICVGVVSAEGTPPDLLAGDFDSDNDFYDDMRQVYISR